jgi:ABC-type multidrug transport system ATPase subunit
MQSRLNYILLTIGNSDLYLFDEPTAALDVVAKQDVWKSIQELKKDSIVILTTHDMEEAEYLADQVIVLNKGTLKEHDNVLELKKKYRNIGRLILSNAKMKLPTLDY